MEETLKVTNVLSDPTRYSIYETFLDLNKAMTVNDVAQLFDIHPNVARLHLSKLSEINLLKAHFQKNSQGGRPSRVYELSDHVIELSFPHRDYRMFAKMMLESFIDLGDLGKEALYNTGKKYGTEIMSQALLSRTPISPEDKIKTLEKTSKVLGMYPKLEYNKDQQSLHLTISNCPFKELAEKNTTIVCQMHNKFLKGMLSVLFPEVTLIEEENMLKGCSQCKYLAEL